MTYEPSQVRAWAHEAGEPVAERGRLSYHLVTAYLKANPQVARELASEHDLPVPSRGAVSLSTCAEIALLVR
jgi:hypothetical protein